MQHFLTLFHVHSDSTSTVAGRGLAGSTERRSLAGSTVFFTGSRKVVMSCSSLIGKGIHISASSTSNIHSRPCGQSQFVSTLYRCSGHCKPPTTQKSVAFPRLVLLPFEPPHSREHSTCPVWYFRHVSQRGRPRWTPSHTLFSCAHSLLLLIPALIERERRS